MKLKPLTIQLGLGILCLAAASQAAPEGKGKTEGRGPTAGEHRSGPADGPRSNAAPGSAKRGAEPVEPKRADKGSRDRREGPDGHDARHPGHEPGAPASGAPAGSADAGEPHAHHDHHNGHAGTVELERRGHRRARVHELRAKWGEGTLTKPAVRDELKNHAWRVARLQRMRELATEKKNDKVLAKLDKLEQKELERHNKAMARHQAGGAPASSATPAASQPAAPTPAPTPAPASTEGAH